MARDQVLIAVTATPIVEYEDVRTVLNLANTDQWNIIYVSDEPAPTILNSFPVFPYQTVSLMRILGDEPEKAYWGIAAVASTLAWWSQYGEAVVEDIPPTPQQTLPPGILERIRRGG